MDYTPPRSLQSIGLFSATALLFVVLFLLVVWVVDRQQTLLLDRTRIMQSERIPEILVLQRRARYLDKIRSTGDQVLYAPNNSDRQVALLYLNHLAKHPNVLNDVQTALLVDQAFRFLTDASQVMTQQALADDSWRQTWQSKAKRLSQLADDAMTQSSQMIAKDMERLSDISRQVRLKMFFIMALVGTFLLVFFWLLHRQVLKPLQLINRSLIAIKSNDALQPLPQTGIKEIHSLESALVDLQQSVQDSVKARQDMEYLAHHDLLTGLPNRRYFIQKTMDKTRQAAVDGQPVTIGLVDIDYFKRINDEFGHAAGDAVLTQFADIFRSALREGDDLCRYGGEEFAFALIGADLSETQRISERLRVEVQKFKFQIPGGKGPVSLSISLGLAQIDHQGFDRALSRADDALYLAKQAGRNKTVIQAENRFQS